MEKPPRCQFGFRPTFAIAIVPCLVCRFQARARTPRKSVYTCKLLCPPRPRLWSSCVSQRKQHDSKIQTGTTMDVGFSGRKLLSG